MTDAGAALHHPWPTALARLFERGRLARGILAWLIAAVGAVVAGATVTVAYLLARETLINPPFPASEWWVFINLWRPLVIAGAILVPMFSGPLTAAAVWLIRRNGWRRPLADMVAGAVCGLASLALLVTIARNFGPMGDGP